MLTMPDDNIMPIDDVAGPRPGGKHSMGQPETHRQSSRHKPTVSKANLASREDPVPETTTSTKESNQLQHSGAQSASSPRIDDTQLSRSLAPNLDNRVASPLTDKTNSPKLSVSTRPDQRQQDPNPDNATVTTLSSVNDDDDEGGVGFPFCKLRRRPGGDLRKIQNVNDLQGQTRYASLESLTPKSDSLDGSMLAMSSLPNSGAPKVLPGAQRPVSLIDTHSSQHLRPSFEAAIAGFSSIPDDDDGGLEATLLKLEGRYEKKSPIIEQGETDDSIAQTKGSTSPRGEEHEATEQEKKLHRHEHAQEDAHPTLTTAEERINSVAPDLEPQLDVSPSHETPVQEVSGKLSTKATSNHDHRPLLQQASVNVWPRTVQSKSSKLSTEPHAAIVPPHLKNENSSSARSFLLGEDENLSDLSSEISVDIIDYSEALAHTVSPMHAAPGTAISGLELPSHPLAETSESNLTLPALSVKPMTGPPLSLTPESSLREWNGEYRVTSPSATPPAVLPSQGAVRLSRSPGHIPFILACDSQMLAQQFTLVEQAALSEVEWADLVEMRWDNKSATFLNWVDYLSTQDVRGVDLVITRFNIMVKWALSEIVLTQNIDERARAITKYIHIATHARMLHNYATMLQLTVALTSSDCTRLKKTWDLVSPEDRALLKGMEILIQPVRNFHDLRLEMESTDLSGGCIPFMGKRVNTSKGTLAH